MSQFSEILETHKNVMIGKKRCPFCEKARKVLADKNIDYHYIDNENPNNHEMINQVMSEYNHRSFPVIFLGGEFMG